MFWKFLQRSVMARLVGTELPDDLFKRLSGKDLAAHREKAVLIATVDSEGQPHPAMLSYFEIIARDRGNIRLATYRDSTTTRNMRRNGKLTLSIIDEGVAYYIKGTVQELKPELATWPGVAKLNLRVDQVLSDQANENIEAGAYITGGVTYRSPNRPDEQTAAVFREMLE